MKKNSAQVSNLARKHYKPEMRLFLGAYLLLLAAACSRMRHQEQVRAPRSRHILNRCIADALLELISVEDIPHSYQDFSLACKGHTPMSYKHIINQQYIPFLPGKFACQTPVGVEDFQ